MKNYKAVILAGGKATRLYPITYEIPKSLLPVKKKPIINYLVDLFYSQEIKDITVLINKDFREKFDWWQKKYYPKNKIKIFEEKKPLGTFGGLYFLRDWVGKNLFFFTNGDELKKIDLAKMADFHQESKTPATVALVKVTDPRQYGAVISKNGKIKQFLEKPENPPSSYISSGLYIFSPEIFDYHPGPKFSMVETDLFPKLAREGKLGAFKFKGKWMDCGTFSRYEKALKEWNKTIIASEGRKEK